MSSAATVSLFPKRDVLKEITIGTMGLPEGTHLRKAYPYLRDVKSDFRFGGFPAAIYPFMDHVSPARLTMYGKHQSQAVVIAKPEHPRIYSGIETDHASYATNTSRREEDIEILKAIPKYRLHHGNFGAKEIPSYLVIYRGMDSREINAFEINRYESRAEEWGYKNNWHENNIRKYLRDGEPLGVGTVLSTPPTVEGPRHRTGINGNVCYIGMAEADQDAVIISDRFAEKMKAFGILKRQVIIPPNYVMLPIHATEEFPNKAFLDVGEKVPKDGVFCVFRKINVDRFSADASEASMRQYDPNLDIVIKAPPGSTLVDNNYIVNKQHIEELPQQIKMYVEDNRDYWRSILDIYNKYPKAKLGDHFNRVVFEAVNRLVGLGEKVHGIDPKDATEIDGFKNSVVDFVHAEFSFFYDIPVQSGTKITGRKGTVLV